MAAPPGPGRGRLARRPLDRRGRPPQRRRLAEGWAADGVGKWVAYDRRTGELVGRGGLSRLGATAAVTGQVVAALGEDGWARDRLELGWTVRSERSRAVMERLGMRLVGQLLVPGLVEGRAGVHDGGPFALYLSRLAG